MREEANDISPPSIKTWEELYKAATEFKEIGAWNWMWDSDMFGNGGMKWPNAKGSQGGIFR